MEESNPLELTLRSFLSEDEMVEYVMNLSLDSNNNNGTESFVENQQSSNSITVIEEWEQRNGPLMNNQSRRFIPCNDDMEILVMGRDNSYSHKICHETGDSKCQVQFISKTSVNCRESCIVVRASNTDALNKACLEIESRISHILCYGDKDVLKDINIPPNFASLHRLIPEERRHFIVDNSVLSLNPFGNAENLLQVDIENLWKIINGSKITDKNTIKVVVGSSLHPAGSSLHPANPYSLNQWEKQGFRITILPNSYVGSYEGQLVDSHLIGETYAVVGDHNNDPHGFNTLVALIGHGSTLLLEGLIHAALNGWRVEVWTWKSYCSSQYISLSYLIPDGRFSIHFLDDYSNDILINSGANDNRSIPNLSESSDSNLCVVCYENRSNYLLLPCKHFPGCVKCSESLKICPICRANIESGMTIFPS
eukprot:gene9035-12181_t